MTSVTRRPARRSREADRVVSQCPNRNSCRAESCWELGSAPRYHGCGAKSRLGRQGRPRPFDAAPSLVYKHSVPPHDPSCTPGAVRGSNGRHRAVTKGARMSLTMGALRSWQSRVRRAFVARPPRGHPRRQTRKASIDPVVSGEWWAARSSPCAMVARVRQRQAGRPEADWADVKESRPAASNTLTMAAGPPAPRAWPKGKFESGRRHRSFPPPLSSRWSSAPRANGIDGRDI